MGDSSPTPLIYNPASGGGRGQHRYEETARLLQKEAMEFIPHPTGYPGHATHLARELALAGHKRIYVLGGDGTVSEAANGILQCKKRPVLGCIPTGTGNDFLRDFDCTTKEEAIRRIIEGKERSVDAGRIRFTDEGGEDHTRYFINIFGTGFAPQVTDLTNRKLKWMGGGAYHAAVIARLVALKSCPTDLYIDGSHIEGDFPMVMVCNSVNTGGAMKMAPNADATDGWFDVVRVNSLSRLELLKLFPKIFTGDHVKSPKVSIERAKKIKIVPRDESPLLADGEVYGRTPVSIEMMEHAFKILQ